MPKSKSAERAKELERAALAIEFESKLARAKRANKELQDRLNGAHRLIETLQDRNDTLYGLNDRKNAKAWSLPASVDRGEAAAVLVITDVHIAEVVRPSQVLGLNEFNHKIVAKRLEQVAQRSIGLLKKERTLADIREGVVFLGGDIIGGKIHADQVECNDLGLASSIDLAEELLERLLRTYFELGKFERMSVVCLSGNHDRATPKVQSASFVENSHATTIYRHLRKRFATLLPGVQWILGDGEYADLPVFGWNIRLTHGHRIKFGGGVGGLSIPWAKHVQRLNKGKHADFTIGGHLHTWTYNSESGFLVNGSVIGTTAYSLPFGHQPPVQSFVVVDRERCVTSCAKVFCE